MSVDVLFKSHLTGTAIAAATALLTKMVAAGIFGAIYADAGGCLVTDAALKTHHFLFYLPRLRHNLASASLRFGIGDFVVLFTLVGKIDRVLLKFLPIRDIFGARAVY